MTMKKILLTLVATIWMCCLASMNASAQNWRSYDCNLFRISIPTSYRLATKNITPGLLFEAENSDAFFQAAATGNYFSNSISAWDDVFYDAFDEYYDSEDYEMDNVERYMLSTLSGKRKCLRVSAHKNCVLFGMDFYMNLIFYFIVHRGHILTFSYGEVQDYPFSHPYLAAERLLSHLKFK